ncbi:MAG TPA: glycosyltransferase family 2 protein [Solirubrobacteraceae bacterium]|nr:glycosyltransferase family 2 protein [Solirubrobacteraceae bacterium]
MEPDAALASVVVVCWNAQAVVGRCLEQLLEQDYPNFELIVVDDGSTDGTLAVAEAAAATGALKLVRGGRNRGCPAARNIGLRHARGELVAFVDADGFAAPDWLRRVVASFEQDRGIGGVASTVFYADNPLVLNGAGGTVNRQGWAADLSMNESYEDAELATEALYPMGCGMAFTREALERVGAFDERMVNYYDDVDYGIRVWRAGYRVLVAGDAWIDHGSSGAGGESLRKRMLCERHRVRVVLKHAPARSLTRWAAGELRSLREAPKALRRQKLAAIAWNALHLPSALAARRRQRGVPHSPARLVDDSWGDAFPAGVPERSTPVPEHAGARAAMDDPGGAQLLYGWFPPERAGERSYRWAGDRAALLISLVRPVRRLRLDYAHVPEDIGGVELAIRRIDSDDPLTAVWTTRLGWQYIARSIENHPLELSPGDYEVRLSVAAGWREPPLKVRSLSLALAAMSFEERFELAPGGLVMSAPGVEDQLVRGWYEAEHSPVGTYRWSSAHAAAVVSVGERASAVRLRYRMAPGPSGAVTVSLTPVGAAQPALSWQIPWRHGEWCEEELATSLGPGDYIVDFDTAETWSNVGQRDSELPPENRALGLALAELRFL